MNTELLVLRILVGLLLAGLPLAAGLVAHLGEWPRPAGAWPEVRPASEVSPVERAAA